MKPHQLILIVEDDEAISRLLQLSFKQLGHKTLLAKDRQNALREIQTRNPDIILLDLGLPDGDGKELIKTVRALLSIPIIVVSARSDEEEIIAALDAGADDYVTKPFSPKELIARVKAVLRRREEKPLGTLLKSGTLELDLDKYMIRVKSKPVHLTSKEYELLRTLIQARGRVLSREHLLDQVWGYDPSFNIETRTVDMHIGQLRKKIKSEGHRIVTVKNAGYRFDLDA